MKDEHMISIAMDLSQVPDGAVTAERHGMDNGEKCFSAEHLTSRTDGKGRIEIFRVMPRSLSTSIWQRAWFSIIKPQTMYLR